MDALLAALVALMAVAAAMAAVLSTLSKAAIFALLAVAPCVYRYRKRIYVIIKTLPRDTKFLWRYANAMVRSKRWGRHNLTVADLFTQRALKQPDAPCFIVVGDRTWTFREMAEKSNQVSRVMQEHVGLKRGDVVCVFMPNCAEYVWTWLGMAKVGAVSALINSNLRHKPLLHCIQVAKAKAIVFSEQLAGAIEEVRSQLSEELKLFQLYGQCAPGVIDLADAMSKHPPEYPIVTDKPGYKDTLLYIYTSGTTGMPKAAVMPNSKYLLVVVATVHMLGLKSSDRMYNPLPLYHTAGGVVGTCAALVDGIPSVLRAKFSASNYWTDCIKHDATVAQYIGEMCRYLLAQPARPTDSQHRVRIMVGNGMRPAIWQQIVDRFKVPQINEIYGATEGNANIINVDNTVGAVGFLPKLVPTALHPIALVRSDEQGNLVRGPDGYCIRCQPMGAVGFLPKLVPTAVHPIALVRSDKQGNLVRGPDGYCIRCQPSE
ncbi:AMP-binding enzyme domain-containing protein [Phthorimaea operculella]|nr:AMP-binding enzyme domain-containing protein [Phthorimaea operculella]